MLRRLRRRAAVRPVDHDAHRPQGAARPEDMLAIARLGAARIAALRHHDDRRLQLLRGRRDRRRRARAARDRLPRGLRRRSRATRSSSSSEKRARVEEIALVRIGVSPHAPYTCSLDTYRCCLVARHPGRHAPRRERERERVARRTAAGRSQAIARSSSRRPGKRAGRRRSSPCSAPSSSAPTASTSTPRRSRSSPRATCRSPTAHARTPCSAAASRRSTELRAAGVRVGLGTDSPASTPSFDMFEELRAAIYAARARERRADALRAADALALATIDAARALRLDAEVGTLTARKARRPDGRLARREPVPSGRGSRQRRSCSAAHRTECSRRSSTDRPATGRPKRRAVARGTQHRKRRTGPNARKPATAPQ